LLLLIKHADGWITAYSHNDQLLVNADDSESGGQAIADVCSTGTVARLQLRVDFRKDTRSVDSLPLLERAGGQSGGSRSGVVRFAKQPQTISFSLFQSSPQPASQILHELPGDSP